ncbi:MAG: acyl-CoA dehydrogenase family protein, partial [Gammaproteobacteria bacterium]|nr:acyl-CoA dehydrogenase family protein [Gammaproteobacteria bacterium]
GTKEQKQRFLPGILTGEDFWCQGYSEPNSGSDLASLRCRAERDGNDYIINGTKIWTTDGHKADFMFGLFRTDSTGKKQHGITFLMLDIRSPGVSMTPIITFEGGHEVNQVFFDNVRVPVKNRLGEENLGWSIAKYVLGLERFGTAEVSRSLPSLNRLKKIAATEMSGGEPLINDHGFAEKLADVEIDLRALEITEQRFLFGPGGPDAMGPEASMLKIRGTEVQQMITELTAEALGYYAQPYVPEQLEAGHNEELIGRLEVGYASSNYFNMRKTSIYSGSNEIQKNIIAKAVLGL